MVSIIFIPRLSLRHTNQPSLFWNAYLPPASTGHLLEGRGWDADVKSMGDIPVQIPHGGQRILLFGSFGE